MFYFLFLAVLIVSSSAGVFWLAAFSSWVSIDRVNVESSEGVDAGQVRQAVFEQMERQAFWFMSEEVFIQVFRILVWLI